MQMKVYSKSTMFIIFLVWQLTWSNNGKYLCTVSKDGTAILYEYDNKKQSLVQSAAITTNCALGYVEFNQRDTLLLLSQCGYGDTQVVLWNLQNQTAINVPNCSFAAFAHFISLTAFLHGTGITSINATEHAQTFAISQFNGKDVRSTLELTITLPKTDHPIHDMRLLPKSTTIFFKTGTTTRGCNQVMFYDLPHGMKQVQVYKKDITRQILLNGSCLGTHVEQNLLYLNVRPFIISDTDPLPTLANYFEVQVWDMISMQLKQVLRGADAHSNTEDGSYFIWPFAKDQYVSTGSENSEFTILNEQMGHVVATLGKQHNNLISIAAMHPQHMHVIASASDDHTVRLYA